MASLVVIFLLAAANTAFAQSPTSLVAGYSAVSGHHAILWIANDAGLFKKNGLNVEMVLIRSGSTHAQALVAGGTQISQLAGTSGLAAGVAGADIVFVSMYLNTAPFVIYGTVEKLQDLKGKAVGVTRYGSTTDISARFALKKIGLQPEKDVALIQLEDYPGILGSIKSGRVAAGVLAPPFTDHAQKLGYKPIMNVADLGLEFPFAGLAARKTYIRDHADIVQRFLRAHIEALAIFKKDRDLTMRILKKYTGIEDPAVLASTVDFYAPKFPRAPYPTAGGIRLALDQIAATDPRAKNARPEEFMDTRFVKQLDENGFIQRLYAAR